MIEINNDPNIILRGPTENDFNFLIDSWSKELKGHFPYKLIPEKTFFIGQNKIINLLLKNSLVLIASPKEYCDQILGYIVFEKIEQETIIHFTYVKKVFRNNGIGKKLLHAADERFSTKPIIITHLPRSVSNIDILSVLKTNKLFYDPYVINRRIKSND